MPPEVTIITPAFNSAQFIAQTHKSILAQTHSDWEWIVVDDASTDATVDIVTKLANADPRISLYVNSENRGAAKSRNTAIKHAKGRFIAFLDADDIWRTDKLRTQISFMKQGGIGLCYAAYDVIDDQGKKISQVRPPASVTYHELLRGNIIGCLTAIYDREVYGKVFMPDIRKRQDYALWLRLLKHRGPAQAAPGVLADYRRHRGSLSNNKFNAIQHSWRMFRDVEGFSRAKTLFYVTQNIIKAVHTRITAKR